MKNVFSLTGVVFVYMLFALSSCSVQDDKPAKPAGPTAKAPAEKAPAKAKVARASGDIGLLDTEKNYLILVTKQGKLITLDFDQKTKVTKLTPTPAKMTDIGLGNSATVTYTKQKDKNVARGIDYKAKK
ncbi:MAG: hypothetical protein ACREQ7_23465 [Candidatus Binatia bacterium]